MSKDLELFNRSLRKWQKLSGWPVFADPLSGIDSTQIKLINHWELLLAVGFLESERKLNVLRLGPLPASRSLEKWLLKLQGKHVIVTEGDKRYLDPLRLSKQWSYGLNSWVETISNSNDLSNVDINSQSRKFITKLTEADSFVALWLNEQIKLTGRVTEPSIARCLPSLLPEDFNFMLSASSPIRDWIVFGGSDCMSKTCFGFRGASGIDGTLSLAMGLASALGPLVLVTGDLALLHDTNGWLFTQNLKPPLIVLLIDNGGGGIFNQLEIEKCFKGNFEDLFQMPQRVDPLVMASAHSVHFRQISILEDLESSIEWGISLKEPVLLRVCTSPNDDKKLREDLKEGLKEHLGTIIKNQK